MAAAAAAPATSCLARMLSAHTWDLVCRLEVQVETAAAVSGEDTAPAVAAAAAGDLDFVACR